MPKNSELKQFVEETISKIYVMVYDANGNLDETTKQVLNGQLEVLKTVCNICNKRGRF